ncbi:MAG: ATP phosphoribosyltransferase regulatory subunit [Chloroflexota bacterium]|nr:ATP phosphoribosyltransferase regulatory subunit [Chloroflexota bacterium]
MINQPLDKQLPHGVADLFFNDAARKRAVERTLADTFAGWGYAEIIPPSFEYYESLAAEAGPQLREEMYRFFDRDGRTLALRADFTIPIARIVGTKLFDRVMPLRFFYVGSAFRYEEPQAGVRREFTQAGIELIGAATADADAEAIALAMTALRGLGLAGFRFTLGNAAYVQATTRDLALNDADDRALREAIRRKNTPALMRLLNVLNLDAAHKRALAQLPTLTGSVAVLDRAECVNADARAAIEHLRAVVARLASFGLNDSITLDLAENRGMEYYTGILFEGFAESLGFAVASGGRYDNLIAHFGPRIPAVGFAIGVERVLLALRSPGAARVSIAPEVIAQEFDGRVADARAQGRIVEVDVLDRDDNALRHYARLRGAREIWWRDGRKETRTNQGRNE